MLLAAMALIVVGVGHRAAFIQLDNSPETFFAADARSGAIYEEMKRAFGPDEVVYVELLGASSTRADDLLALARLARDIEAVDGVSSVLSVASIFDANTEAPTPSTLPAHALDDVASEVDAFPLYRALGLVDASPPSLGLLAAVTVADGGSRGPLSTALDSVARRHSVGRYRVSVAGLTATHAAFDRLTRRALFTFMPGVVLLSVLVGLVIFRSGRALAAMFVPPLAAVVLGVAGLEIAGQPLNLLTAVLPPLTLVIGFAAAIHFVSHYAASVRAGATPETAARLTIEAKLAPTAFAFGTTAIGFGSLAVSAVPVVRVLGIAAGLMIVVMMAAVILGTPAFLVWLRPRIHMPEHRQVLVERIAIATLQRRGLTLAGASIVSALVIAGMWRLETSINGTRMLSPGTPERVAFERFEREGRGLGNIELWIRRPLRSREELLAERDTLRRLSARLSSVPGVTATISAADLADVAELRLARLEERTGSRTEALRTLGGDGRFLDLLARFWSPREGLLITVLTRIAERPEQVESQRRLLLRAARDAYPNTPIELTGHYELLIRSSGALTVTMVESLGGTVLVVTLLFLILLRSARFAVAALVVNLAPVAMVLGVMGWLGIELDVATVMMGSIVFGLAVDDTFHYLYHRRATGSIRCAAAIAGQGIVATSMVIVAGFGSLGLSGFLPVVRLGTLSALGVALALGFDVLVLPALVGARQELEASCAEDGSRPPYPPPGLDSKR
jgi:predicted RND superfamily exporter protein